MHIFLCFNFILLSYIHALQSNYYLLFSYSKYVVKNCYLKKTLFMYLCHWFNFGIYGNNLKDLSSYVLVRNLWVKYFPIM